MARIGAKIDAILILSHQGIRLEIFIRAPWRT